MFECQGIVKRFSKTKGYGFLGRDDGGPEVFVHFNAIQTMTHKSLKKGAIVRFKVVQGPKGLQAEWVYVVKPPTPVPHPASLPPKSPGHFSASAP